MDTYPFCTKVLFEAASLARRVDGEVIVFYVINIVEKEAVEQLGIALKNYFQISVINLLALMPPFQRKLFASLKIRLALPKS